MRLLRTTVMLIAVTIGSVFLVEFLGPLRVADNTAADLLHVVAYPRTAVSNDVVVVAITEETLEALPYRSPVDRAFLANLIERILAAQPASVGIDIIFDRPTEPAKDERLRHLLSNAGGSAPLVTAYADERDGLLPKQATYLDRFLSEARVGFATVIRDPDDGVVRNFATEYPSDHGFVASLAHEMAATEPEPGQELVQPLAFQAGNDLNAAPFAIYPAHVLAQMPGEWLRGKHVLVGADLPNIDRYETPLSTVLGSERGDMTGVLVHAQVLQQLLDGRTLVRAEPPYMIAATVIAAVLGFLAMAVPASIYGRGLALMFAMFALILASFVLLRFGGISIGPLAPALALGLAATGEGVRQFSEERARRRQVRRTFECFVPPSVVKRLLAAPDALTASAERRAVTCIFTDIAGFTILVERTPPEQLQEILNSYLSGITEIFFSHEATIDKFVGDAVVGFVGAPIARPDHAAVAVKMALEIDEFAQGFADRILREHDITFGETRIGVHSGCASVGNFGSNRFFDYTAMGDVVNTASRIEAINKEIGTRLCISAQTVTLIDDVACRPLGAVRLRGKELPVELFEAGRPERAREPNWIRYIEACVRNSAESAHRIRLNSPTWFG